MTKRRAATLLFSATLVLYGASPPPTRVGSLPGLRICSTVAVAMVNTVDSASAQPGDFFRFQTVDAIRAGKKVLIPAHTVGYGVVSVASGAGAGGRAGSLVLEPEYLVLPNGTQLGVVLDHYAGDMMRSGRSDGVPDYLGAAPVPGLFLAVGLFNAFHHGKNVQVKKGTKFSIFPADGPQTERCQQHPDT